MKRPHFSMKKFCFAALGLADIEVSLYTSPTNWMLLVAGVIWILCAGWLPNDRTTR